MIRPTDCKNRLGFTLSVENKVFFSAAQRWWQSGYGYNKHLGFAIAAS